MSWKTNAITIVAISGVFAHLQACAEDPNLHHPLGGLSSDATDPSAETGATAPNASTDWPSWRGVLGTGHSPDARPPLSWSEQENVRWKRDLPGLGHSTPVVSGDRIFLTTAIPFGEPFEPLPFNTPPEHDNVGVSRRHQFAVLCLRLSDGELMWQRVAREAIAHEGGHRSASLASASPVTDGEYVIASFGSQGVYGLSVDGELLWERDLGLLRSKHAHGEGSSPAMSGDTVVVVSDHEGPSFLVALDRKSGAELWRVERDEVTSWSSPLIVDHGGITQVIVNGTHRVRGYDLASGAVLWECGGLSNNVCATPVAGGGMVFVGSSYETKALMGIRLDGAVGDITGTDHVAWFRTRGTPYVPSPLLYEDTLYFLSHYQGVITGIDAATGDVRRGPFRLPEIHEVYASLVGANDRIYILDRNGVTAVVAHDGDPRILASNALDDTFSASPVLAGDAMILRGERHLYLIAETPSDRRGDG